MGTTSSATARPISDQMMIGSFGARSTSTPTKRPKSAKGTDSSAVSTPISNGVASRSSAAVSGSARKVIWPPKCVIVSEVHNRTKSALRHNPFNIVLLSQGARLRVALCARREESAFGLLAPPRNSRRTIGPRGQSLPERMRTAPRSGRLEMICAKQFIRGRSIPRSVGQRIKCNGETRRVARERLDAVPHVGRKEDELAQLGTHMMVRRKLRPRRHAGPAKAQPAGARGLGLHHRGNRDVKRRGQPAALVDMIDVVTAGRKAHAPRAGDRVPARVTRAEGIRAPAEACEMPIDHAFEFLE